MPEQTTPTPTQVLQLAGVTGIDPSTIRRAYGLRRDHHRTRAVTLYALRAAAAEIGVPAPPPTEALSA